MIANRDGYLRAIDFERVNIDMSENSIRKALDSTIEDMKDYRKETRIGLYFLCFREKMFYKWKLRHLKQEKKKLDKLYLIASKRIK